jgi:hypothetical protein
VAFIGVGVVLLLQQGGLTDATSVFVTWWPTLIIAAGVGQIVTRPHNLVGGSIVGVIGIGLLLWSLGVIDSPALLWPALLIGIGIWLLTGRVAVTGPVTAGSAGDITTVFDNRDVVAPPGPLQARVLTTVFGDLRLNLRYAVITDTATLQIVTVFGDVDIEVPHDWTVMVSGPEIFGDVSAPRPPTNPSGRVLALRVVTIFGDVRVRSGVLV